jgi:hypothetical protein
MDELFDEIFGSVLAPEEIIKISEEEQYQRYAMSLYERIRRVEDNCTSHTDIESRVLQSEVNSNT